MEPTRTTPDLSELLRHAAWLRRLVAPLLAGNEAIEDVLQETWTAALEKPPAEGTRWRSWLARVAWNRAQRARRETHRRTRREALAAKAETVHSADRLVAELEVQTKLATAVLALEPNQRRAILLRFYEGLPPRVIAEELGVPVATVKTWIYRGIEKLRSSLASDLGVDWRAAFAPLAISGAAAIPAAAIPTTTTLSLLGIVMKAKLALGLLVVAGLGFWSWSAWPAPHAEPEVASTRAATDRTDNEISKPRSSATNLTGVVERRAPDNPEVPSRSTAEGTGAAAPHARIRGRCIDEQGVPLAGVTIALADEAASDTPPPIVTPANGSFEIQCDPLPGHLYELRASRADRVSLEGRRLALAPQQLLELGDLALPAGCVVSGIVRNAEGTPRNRLTLSLVRRIDRSQPQPLVACTRHLNTRTREDGTFRFEERAAVGTWNFEFVEEPQSRAHVLEIQAERADAFVEIELEPRFVGSSIAGIVVDEGGRPMGGARVHFGIGDYASSDHRGNWRITQRGPDASPPRALKVERPGFEPLITAAEHRWGEQDVRLVLTRAADLEIVVRDGKSGAPIEEFALRLLMRRGDSIQATDSEMPARQKHADGKIVLQGLPSGSYRLQVDPTDRTWARSAFVDFDFPAARPRIEVKLEPASMLRVRIEDLKGRPREGSTVDLLEMPGAQPLDSQTAVVSFASRPMGNGPTAIRIDEGVSDAEGSVAMKGPLRRPLTLLVHGPSHIGVCKGGIVFEDDGELVIAVGSGAKLSGRIGPQELLAQLRRSGGVPQRDADLKVQEPFVSTVQLRRRSGEGWEFHPATDPSLGFRNGVLLREDGRFEIEGIPTGSWELLLRYHKLHRHPQASGPYSSTSGMALLAALDDLSEGEVRQLDFDRPDLLLAELSGLVVQNGEPLLHSSLMFVCRKEGERGSYQSYDYAATDGQGRFSILLEAGTYRARSRTHDRTLDHTFELSTIEEIALQEGQSLARDLHIEFGETTLRILDAQGAPQASCCLEAHNDLFDQHIFLPGTDEKGRTRTLLTAGTWRIEVRSAADRKLRQEIGSIHVAAGQRPDAEQELRLPASWTGR